MGSDVPNAERGKKTGMPSTCDTIASMAGNLVGALHGTAWIPDRWRAELEYHDELVDLADRLLTVGQI